MRCSFRDVKNQVYSRKLEERLQEHDPSRNSRRPLEQQPLGQPYAEVTKVGPADATVLEQSQTDERMVHGEFHSRMQDFSHCEECSTCPHRVAIC